MASKTSMIMVGVGGMARHHLRTILKMRRNTSVVGYVEVSENQRQLTMDLHQELQISCPPFYDNIKELVKTQGAADTAFIITPHKFHLENTIDCMKAGMDVLLEKPMVLNENEAKRLIRSRDKEGRLLVVAFPGSLSPAVKKAKAMIASGKLGTIRSISAFAHQQWQIATKGAWRQIPDISGGGFLFDTGSHMINTVVDLGGDDVGEVCAIMDNCGSPVEIRSTISGRFRSGVQFSLAAAGDSMQCCSSITVIGDKGILETGIWGERLLYRNHKTSEMKAIKTPAYKGVWEQFLKVRAGKMENPCPAEVGLRFARLMDLIRKSNESGKTIRSRALRT